MVAVRSTAGRRGKGCLKFIAVLVLLAAGVILGLAWYGSQKGGEEAAAAQREFELSFRDTKSLEKGSAVVSGGKLVGSVARIREEGTGGPFLVLVRLDEDFVAKKNMAKARATVILNKQGQSQVSISVPAAGSDDMRPSTTLEEAKSGLERLFASAQEGIDRAKDWVQSPEAEGLKSQFDELQKRLEELNRTGQDKANDMLKDVLERGTELTEELRAKGEGEAATKLSEAIEKLKKETETLAERGKELIGGSEDESAVQPK